MRAIFLDRDGVICKNRPDHVKSWSEFQFLPGARRSLVALSRLGLPIIIVTNQAAIGRGMVSARVVEDIHQRMMAEINSCGGRIDRIVYCPHRPEEGCECRKPKPGLLLKAAGEMGIDLTRSYMIGDAATDLMAGQRVGCRTFLVLTGRGVKQLWPAFRSVGTNFTIVRNLTRATTHILQAELQIDEVQMENPYFNYYRQLLPTASKL